MNDTQAAVAALETVGEALTAAATHQARIIRDVDGWPLRGEINGGRGNDTTSPTERAALALADDRGDQAGEAAKAKAAIEDMRDWWAGLRIMLADGARLAALHLPRAERLVGMICDGRPFEGSEVAWVPGAKAHDNGWRDPLCVDIADSSGLCVRCKMRERRWREQHGMPHRKRNTTEAAA